MVGAMLYSTRACFHVVGSVVVVVACGSGGGGCSYWVVVVEWQ